MKLLIFGATGGTGRHLVQQALEQGHIVTAFARDPAKVRAKHENLRVLQGDMLRDDSVRAAIAGQHAVLSALGVRIPVPAFVFITIVSQVIIRILPLPRLGARFVAFGVPILALLYLFRRNTALSDGTRNIVQAMQELGVKRFVCESSLGVGDSKWRLGLLYNLVLIPLFLRNVFADKELQERIIRESPLDWVIVRPTALTNGEPRSNYRSGAEIGHWFFPTKISRADVADFMLEQVTGNEHLRKTLGLAY